MRVSNLTSTLASNSCEYVIVTNHVQTYSLNGYDDTHKKAVVISGRVHPGETPASYAIEGFLKFIVSNEP